MVWAGRDVKDHCSDSLLWAGCSSGCPEAQPPWPWAPLVMEHSQLLWASVPEGLTAQGVKNSSHLA